MSQITNYSAMTDVELNAAEANALTALRMVKAERASRKPAARPAALPVTEAVAGSMHEALSNCPTRADARTLMAGYCADRALTVSRLRALAKHWGIGTTSKMRKVEIVDLIIDVLVGGKIQSAAIARV